MKSELEKEDLLIVEKVFALARVKCDRVDAPREGRCDFRATDRFGQRYLVEVKGFWDNEDIRNNLMLSGVHNASIALDSHAASEAAIRKAVEQQFPGTPTEDDALWIVAILNRAVHGAEAMDHRLFATIYGVRKVIYAGPSGEGESNDCLYFSHSAFHRHPKLDAVLLFNLNGDVSLHINDFGNRKDVICGSTLGRYFDGCGAMSQARSLETGGFLFADCDVDRRDEPAVLDYVKRKYGLSGALLSRPKEYSSTVIVSE